MHAALAAWLLKTTPWAKRLTAMSLVGAIVYGCLFYKLGELTFAEHMQRIWRTQEVIDLREGVASKLAGAKGAALDQLKTRLAASRTSD
jgi:hypothetical protein